MAKGGRILKSTNSAAQGGQSDRLVINSFRVSPLRWKRGGKGGEGRGLSSFLFSRPPLPLFYFVLEVSAGNLHVWTKGREGGGGSSHARIETISKRRAATHSPSMRVEYVEYVETVRRQGGRKGRGPFTVTQWLIVRILASVSWILIDWIEA